jgi:predicted dehydrogenase
MIHDIDVVGSLLGGDPRVVSAAGARENRYVTATVDFDGVVADFTASRVTQRRVRKLSVTARECEVTVDYLDQSVRIHRRSTPKYVETDGNVRYRNESVTEHPTVDGQEPLKAELRAFVEAVQTGTDHAVTGADGIRAVEVADEVATLAGGRPEEVVR